MDRPNPTSKRSAPPGEARPEPPLDLDLTAAVVRRPLDVMVVVQGVSGDEQLERGAISGNGDSARRCRSSASER
jgi:hypothetical protein